MKKNRGFTLIEILIALAVFSILAAMTSSAMYYAFNTRARINAQAERLADLQLAIMLIERDISQAINRPIRSNNMQLFQALIGHVDYLEFTRSGLTNPNSQKKRSTLRRIALLCKKGQLLRRSWDRIDLTLRNQFEDKILLNGVHDCKFSYLNKNLQLVTEWRVEASPDKNNAIINALPKAVQISIALNQGGEMTLLFGLPVSLYAKE